VAEQRDPSDPVGKGIEPTENVVEYKIRADQLRAVAGPAMGRGSSRLTREREPRRFGEVRRDGELERIIAEMAERIVLGFQPLRVILFGSQARGDAGPESDVDLLVVLPDGSDRRASVVAILRILDDLPVCKDVVVTTPEEIARRGSLVGTVLRPALHEGRVLYERA
jgi:predicted nucleotidyltransferase